MTPITCDVCDKPGVTPWTIGHGDDVVRRLLCIVHAEPVYLLFHRTAEQAHRYANPGDRQLTSRWVTPRDDVNPMDWMPLSA